MDEWEREFGELDPELAKQIRDAAGRAGLQSHDPAARMIGEMWVAVAALRDERDQLSREMSRLRRDVRDNTWYLMVLVALVSTNLLAILAWLLV